MFDRTIQRRPPHPNVDWWAAEDRESRLRAFWVDTTLSANRIAAILGTTKNAIIGKVHRMGFPQRRPTPPPRAPIDPRPRIGDLGPTQCRYPVTDRDYDHRFCGEPTAPGCPYCRTHARAAYKPAGAQVGVDG